LKTESYALEIKARKKAEIEEGSRTDEAKLAVLAAS
jgi:hypothetical protein